MSLLFGIGIGIALATVISYGWGKWDEYQMSGPND